MPDLHFQVEGADATPNAAVPQITFQVRVSNTEADAVHSVALRTQVQIEPVRRRYSPEEQRHLRELFGEPERWSKTLQPLLWANVDTTVQGFTGSAAVEIHVPCTFDFNVAMTKYVYGLTDGEMPVTLLFSGTIFHARGMGLQIAQIPWDRDASYRLPVSVWRKMMDIYYPNTAWITLHRDVFDRLYEFKSQHGIPTWDQVFERMLGLMAEAKS